MTEAELDLEFEAKQDWLKSYDQLLADARAKGIEVEDTPFHRANWQIWLLTGGELMSGACAYKPEYQLVFWRDILQGYRNISSAEEAVKLALSEIKRLRGKR